MDGILIRKAEREDASSIIRFQKMMALETEGLELDPAELEKGVTKVFGNTALGFYHIAESRGTIIACHLVTYEWSDWRNKFVYWVQSVYVEKEYREKGVFKRMYEKLKHMAAADPDVGGIRLYVVRENLVAQKVYEKLGMDGDHYRMFEWMKE